MSDKDRNVKKDYLLINSLKQACPACEICSILSDSTPIFYGFETHDIE